MKPVVIIAIIFLSSFVVFDSFAQSSEESLGLSMKNMAAYILTAIVILIIPILIILLVIKRKGRLASLTLKKSLGGIGLLFLGVVVLGVAGAMSMSPEEMAEQERQDRHKWGQIKLTEEESQARQEVPTIKLTEQDQKYSNAKNELFSFLQSVNRSTSECNKVPNSVKFSSLVEREITEIIIDSALMVLLIEEAPRDSGLLPYKQKIITAVDKLTDCLNRH